MKDSFIAAIHDRNKIRVEFYSKEDAAVVSRICAPMDYGPSRRAYNKSDRFHFWDFESDTKNHVLSLLPEQIVRIDVLRSNFDPAEFVSWEPNWIVSRDWGIYS